MDLHCNPYSTKSKAIKKDGVCLFTDITDNQKVWIIEVRIIEVQLYVFETGISLKDDKPSLKFLIELNLPFFLCDCQVDNMIWESLALYMASQG